MAETKVPVTLTDADYTAKILLGAAPGVESKTIDITDAVRKSLSYEDVFGEEYGLTNKIIGVYEHSSHPFFTGSPALFNSREFIFLMQDINHILEAAIVNSKQLEATKELIKQVFVRHDNDAMSGVDAVLQDYVQSHGSLQ